MATGVEGFKLGIAGFLVPFAFIYQPELLLHGSAWQVGLAVVMIGLGVIYLASGVIGHLASPLNWAQRTLMIAAASMLVFPAYGLNYIGLAAGALVGLWAYLTGRGSRPKIGPQPA